MMDPKFKEAELFTRSPYLEFPASMPNTLWSRGSMDNRAYNEKSSYEQTRFHTLQYLKGMQEPRVIKSHLPFSHLPPNLINKAKVVYVCRRPKDVIVSYYHHCMNYCDVVTTNLEAFARDFMNGLVPYGYFFSHLKVVQEDFLKMNPC